MIDFDRLVLQPVAAAFAEPVQYYTKTAGPFPMTGIFNDRYQESTFQDGVEVIGISTVLGIRAAQFPIMPTQGESFSVRGILYTIAAPPEPDGMGDLKITLRAATDAEAARKLQRATP